MALPRPRKQLLLKLGVLVTVAGWLSLLCAFFMLGLALVLFAISIAEFRIFDNGFLSLILLSFGISIVLLGISLPLIHVGRMMRQLPYAKGTCPACGYQIDSAPGIGPRCSECGAALPWMKESPT